MLAKLMQQNQHPIERVVRVTLGIVLLALFFAGPRTGWGLLGVIPLVTGFTGMCPLYSLLGINTCRTPKHTTVL